MHTGMQTSRPRLFHDAGSRTLGAQNMRKGNRLAISRVSISDVTRHGGYLDHLRGERSCDAFAARFSRVSSFVLRDSPLSVPSMLWIASPSEALWALLQNVAMPSLGCVTKIFAHSGQNHLAKNPCPKGPPPKAARNVRPPHSGHTGLGRFSHSKARRPNVKSCNMATMYPKCTRFVNDCIPHFWLRLHELDIAYQQAQ